MTFVPLLEKRFVAAKLICFRASRLGAIYFGLKNEQKTDEIINHYLFSLETS
jgi:hypothetical protein